MTDKQPTQEQVLEWAREAGIKFFDRKGHDVSIPPDWISEVVAFSYEAGRKDENDACAEAIKDLWGSHPIDFEDVLYAIRARREQ